jgi:hypothetical protein
VPHGLAISMRGVDGASDPPPPLHMRPIVAALAEGFSHDKSRDH